MSGHAATTEPVSALQALVEDLEWIEANCWIIAKDGRKIPLRYNAAQRQMIRVMVAQVAAGKPLRLIVLKARQLGISTLFMALSFARTYRRDGVKAAVLAHQDQTTKELWGMNTVFTDQAPHTLRSVRRFARANGPLVWRHNSRMNCATAGGRGVGHGGTLSILHLSEAARYGTGGTELQQARVLETVSGIRASLADTADSVEVVESTANGVGGWFHTEWQRAVEGKSDYAPVFIAWFAEPAYVAPLGTCGLAGPADLSDYERSLVDRFGLTLEQLCWRRWKLENSFAGDLRKFKEQYPSTPEEAFITSGASVFDPERIAIYLHRTREPVWRGDVGFEPPRGWLFVDDPAGPCRVWRYPRKNRAYCLFADVAECLDTQSDRDAVVVRDAKTLDIVATLAGRWELGDFARRIAGLGWYYNQALVAVERNNPGPAVIGTLRGRLGGEPMYRRLYRYKHVDKATGESTVVYGFPTSKATKAAMVEAQQRLLRLGLEDNPSAEILGEAATYVYGPNRTMGASPGCHDDLVIAWCGSALIAPEAALYERAARKWAAQRMEDLLDSEDDTNPFVSEIQV